ncbi:MAG: InlB B-repeat-containing protein [Anaeroplasmataceae bacterium]|nr:InlB B-repeat-containing protein [Anaeroplasmataceae bacterium]
MKKVFALFLLLFGIILVSCKTTETLYTITYHIDKISDSTYTTIEKEYSPDYIIKEDEIAQKREGYILEGWYFDSNLTDPVHFPYIVSKDTDFYAKWIKTYIVTLYNADEVYKTIEIEENKALSSIDNPEKQGHTFLGWSTNKDTFIAFNPSTIITADTTLYAFFSPDAIPEAIDVTFMDGNTSLHIDTIEKGTTVQAFTAPTKPGFIFRGWSTSKDAYEEFNFSTTLNEDTTLYAFYNPVVAETIDVTFMDGDSLLHTDTIKKGSTAQAFTAPTKPGFTFRGWSTNKDTYVEFDFSTKINEDTLLYAFYNPVVAEMIDVTFMDGDSLLHTDTIEKGSTAQAFSAPTKPGFIFKGWSTNKDIYEAFNFSTTLNEDTTLYAFYDSIPEDAIVVTFKDGNTDLHTIAIDKGSIVQEFTAPTKPGYTFRGWSTNKDIYEAFNFSTTLNEDTTLYAFYTINTYSVTFYNGNVVWSTKIVEYNTSVVFPAAPTKTGYTFKGWSTNKDVYTPFDETTKITGNTSLFAYFDINKFTVKFIDGDVIETQSIEYNSTAAIPADPIRAGYIFKGWSTSQNTLVLFNPDTKITKDTNLYAYFVEELTITFIVNNKITTIKIEKGTTVSEPEAPSNEGQSFMGWYYNDTKFDFSTKINESIELIARFEEIQIEVTNYSGYNEGLFFEATPVTGAVLSDYMVTYKPTSSTTWTTADKELIREENNKIRCDIVGLPAGNYDVKLTVADKSRTLSCAVEAQDRSGYAHFNYSDGVGAYNDDGTLKSNAIVVYVTNETKNTVKVGSYTGLVSILQNQSKIGKPLAIRIIGKITTNQYKYKSNAPRLIDNSNLSDDFFDNELETTYGDNLIGLTVQYMDKKEKKSYKYVTTSSGLELKSTGSSSYKETSYNRTDYPEVTGKTVYDDDSYFNMLDIEAASEITLEGIGTNAEFFQWGLTWKKCNSIEVKNITFTDYTEDACSFEASSNSDVNNYGHYWIHNNTFNRGKNNWDISGERDKYAGDGGIDVKYINSVTLSYNKFNNCKKTGLVGGDNKNYTKNITFHHNYYYKVESRLPLGRQANMHIYNNYYEDCGTCQDIRANAFVLSEANYFQNCTSPQKVTTDTTYKNTIIKSVNDYWEGCDNKSQATVSTRTQSLDGNCKPDGSTNYTNFDTNKTLFYYTGTGSDVSILHETSEVPEYCKTYSGVLKSVITPGGGTTTPDPNPTPNPDPTPDPDPQPPVTGKTIISFNSLTTGDITNSVSTSSGATVQKGSSTKTMKIVSTDITLGGEAITKYVNVGGGGNYSDLSIQFTTTGVANITIYYANPGSSGDRYIAMYTPNAIVAHTTTGATGGAGPVSYTYENMEAGSYAVTSAGSGLNIYLIIIEYI